jgi:ParB-like chromosome segregation protein Spo0J
MNLQYPKPVLLPAVDLSLVNDTEDGENPNMLPDEDFRGLVESISKLDFAQAITICEVGDGRYRLIDGQHRKRASLIAKRQTLPALVYPAIPEENFRALRLALNRWRGEARASAVHADIRFLHEAGFEREYLFAAGGLSSEDLDAVLGVATELPASAAGLDDIPDPETLGTAPAPLATGSPSFEVPCSSPASYQEMMNLLKRAARGAKAKGKFRIEATLRAALRAYVGED